MNHIPEIDDSIDLESELYDNLEDEFESDEDEIPCYLQKTIASEEHAPPPPPPPHLPPQAPTSTPVFKEGMTSEQRLQMIRKLSEDKVIAENRAAFRIQQAEQDQQIANEIAQEILNMRNTEQVPLSRQSSTASTASSSSSASTLPMQFSKLWSGEEDQRKLVNGVMVTGWESLFQAFRANNQRETWEPAFIADARFNDFLRQWDESCGNAGKLQNWQATLDANSFTNIVYQFLLVVLDGIRPSPNVRKYVLLLPDSFESPLGTGGNMHSLGRVCAAFKRVYLGLFHTNTQSASFKPLTSEEYMGYLKRFCALVYAYLVWRYPLLETIVTDRSASTQQDEEHTPSRAATPDPSRGTFDSVFGCEIHHTVRAIVEDIMFNAPIREVVFAELERDHHATDERLFHECSKLADQRNVQLMEALHLDNGLFLLEEDAKLAGTSNNIPYFPVVQLLVHAWEKANTPHEKLKFLVASTRQVYIEIETHDKATGNNKRSAVGADDLLPIMLFCVVHSRPKNLASQCSFMDAFLANEQTTGESGYALTLVQTAVAVLGSGKVSGG